MTTNTQVVQQVLSQSSSWRQAVTDLVDLYTAMGTCFTSGHIVRDIRTHRSDFAFRQRTVGEMVQDMFWTNKIVYNGQSAVQVPRTTTGQGRTPAGIDVFVYAPDQATADGFDFEVDIPRLGNPAPQQTSTPSTQPTTTVAPAPAKPAQSSEDFRCNVHSDKRLCVPRAAMDVLSAKAGVTVTQDTEAWVSLDGNLAVVSFDLHNGAVNYKLSASRGRILFPRPGTGTFDSGDMYQAELGTCSATSGPVLLIDLSTKI